MVARSTVADQNPTQTPPSPPSSSSSSSSSSPPPPPPPARPSAPSPAATVTTHFPPFRCEKDYLLITRTAALLERSGFYWGPLGVEEAHRLLRAAPRGAFLVRDSRQRDVFFTLSYHAAEGPVSVRLLYRRERFSLAGSARSFPCLFGLLEHYMAPPRRSLSAPYRRRGPTLQELCRRRIVEACGGAGRVGEVPVNPVLRDFLSEFPFRM